MPVEIQEADQVIATLRDVVEKKGSNDLLLRIAIRDSIHSNFSQPWCTLGHATIEHVAGKEEWMPDLIGEGFGGTFDIVCYHYSDQTRQVGGIIRLVVPGQLSDGPLIHVVAQKDWRGPKQLMYPKPSAPQPQMTVLTGRGATKPAPVIGGNGAVATGMQQVAVTPGEVRAAASAGVEAASVAEQRARQAAADLEREREALKEARLLASQEALFNKLNSQLETVRAELHAVKSTPTPTPERRKDLVEALKELTPVLAIAAPVIQDLMKGRAEQHATLIKTIVDSNEKNAAMITKVLDKVTEVSTSKKDDPAALMQLSTTMAQAFGTLSNVTVQTLHQMKELNGAGEPPSPFVQALEVLADPLNTLASAFAQRNGTQPPAGQQRQLPAPRPMNSVDTLLAALKARHNTDELVTFFFDKALNTPEMQKAMSEVNYDMEELIKRRVGVAWLAANMDYVNQLRASVDRIGGARGLIPQKTETQPQQPQPEPQPSPSNVVPITAASAPVEEQPVEEQVEEEEQPAEEAQQMADGEEQPDA